MIIGNTLFVFLRLPQPPESKATLGRSWLESKLRKQFPTLKYVEFLDDAYNGITQTQLNDLLQLNYFKNQKYVADKYDCDNYSFSLKGLMSNIAPNVPFGIVHVDIDNDGKHSLNIFYDFENSKFYYVEPQSNKIFLASNYKPYMVII